MVESRVEVVCGVPQQQSPGDGYALDFADDHGEPVTLRLILRASPQHWTSAEVRVEGVDVVLQSVRVFDALKDEKSQQTEQTPKGLTVPVPKRRDFFGNLKKAAEPEKPDEANERGASGADE